MEKNEKSQKILSFYTCVSQMTITCTVWLHNVWFLRYGARQIEFFFFLVHFLTFSPTKNIKNQNFEKMKQAHEDIIILHMHTINENHKMYGSCDMKWDRQNLFILGHFVIFCPTNTPKNQNFEKMKKSPGGIIILHMLQIWFLRYGAQWTDRWMDGKSDT